MNLILSYSYTPHTLTLFQPNPCIIVWTNLLQLFLYNSSDIQSVNKLMHGLMCNAIFAPGKCFQRFIWLGIVFSS